MDGELQQLIDRIKADAVDGQWTDMGTPSGCADDTVRLYCIEQ